MSTKYLTAYFDGSCEPKNPGGNMGTGAIVLDDGQLLFEHSDFIKANPDNSNNVAEYIGLREILRWLTTNGIKGRSIIIHGDSKLVIEQMTGRWKIKNGRYTPYAKACMFYLKELIGRDFSNEITFKWIPRQLNEHCDMLSKKNQPELKIQP